MQTPLTYASGFGNHFASEAVAGALPIGRNSPQQTAFGLYAEQISGTAFTAPRGENRRSWLYRLRPSAAHPPYHPYESAAHWRSAPFEGVSPNRLRWDPLPFPETDVDFVDGLHTYGGNGEVAGQSGVAIHVYAATRSMEARVLVNADGEMLIVPQEGGLVVTSEMGRLALGPGEIAVIPRGVKFTVALTDAVARGYVCETYGAAFRLPELGPIGANGLANPRDFLYPQAWFEDVDTPTEVVLKSHGRLWTLTLAYSPLDVVAWHGNLSPYKYDLARFNTMGTVSFDHPDPSIFTVLTSPSETPGTANCDFVIFPPRWQVAEDTFRPPWFHRNVMSEFMGLIHGVYDAKAGGFAPGGASLHNSFTAHGPDQASYAKAVAAATTPHKIAGALAFMFETRWVIHPTAFALETLVLQQDYDTCWDDFAKANVPR